jgi:hypothetical protein
VLTVHKTDAFSWELESNDEEALRKELLKLAVDQNLNITTLQSGSKNLEEVFRKLTGKSS